jgi:pilus assembly protein FimV
MDFDLSSISLDLDKPVITRPQGLDSARTDLETIDFSTSEDDGSDPLSRKLELAEEFRQIGDTEGARDLLQEVIAKADGALRAKAQGMLDDLG